MPPDQRYAGKKDVGHECCSGISNSFSKYRWANPGLLASELPHLPPHIRAGEDTGSGESNMSPAEPSPWPFAISIPSFLIGNRIHQVTGLDPERLTNLHTLELRANQLETTIGINLPKLKNLYLVAHGPSGGTGKGAALASGRLS